MYETFYRFLEKPFSLTPDPKFLYLSKQHQGALEHMLYGIKQREGFMAITGDVGMGKTTLCRCLLDRLESNIKVALILNPMLSDMDLLRTCIQDLGIRPLRAYQARPVMVGNVDKEGKTALPAKPIVPPPDLNWVNRATKKQMIDALNKSLLEQHKGGGSTVLIIDEAQNLSLEVLEQLRILSNLETEKEKLLQIIFVGQLELNEKLHLQALKQLNQRISVRFEITPMSKEETKNYIGHRILIAGAGSGISFARGALNEIYNYSRGYPRLINLVCDRSLLAGYNAQTDVINAAQVRQAVKSLLGEEDKNYLVHKYLKSPPPFAASILFFIFGLLFFLLSWKTEWLQKAEFPVPPGSRQTITQTAPPVAAAEFAPKIEKQPVQEIPVAEPAPAAVAPDSVVNQAEKKHAPETGETYRIQVYTLTAKQQAQQGVSKLIKEGFPAYWRKVENAGKIWYVVYLGPFNDNKSAKIHFNALKHSGLDPMLYSVAKNDRNE